MAMSQRRRHPAHRRGEKSPRSRRDDDLISRDDRALELALATTVMYRRPDNVVKMLILQDMEPAREHIYELIDIVAVVVKKYTHPRAVHNVLYYLQEDLLRCVDAKNYQEAVDMLYDTKACFHYILNSYFQRSSTWWLYYLTAMKALRLCLQKSCYDRKHLSISVTVTRPKEKEHVLDHDFKGFSIVDGILNVVGRPCSACGDIIYPFDLDKSNSCERLSHVRFRAGIRLQMSGKFLMACCLSCEDLLRQQAAKKASENLGFGKIKRLSKDAEVPKEDMELFTPAEIAAIALTKPWQPRDINKMKNARIAQPKPKPVKPWTMMANKEMNKPKGGIESQYNVHLRMMKVGGQYVLEKAQLERERRASLGYANVFSYSADISPSDVIKRTLFEHYGRAFRRYVNKNDESFFNQGTDTFLGIPFEELEPQRETILKFLKQELEYDGDLSDLGVHPEPTLEDVPGSSKPDPRRDNPSEPNLIFEMLDAWAEVKEEWGNASPVSFREVSAETRAHIAVRGSEEYVLPKKVCITCGSGTRNMKKCGYCRRVYYCSARCQRVDLAPHLKVCARLCEENERKKEHSHSDVD